MVFDKYVKLRVNYLPTNLVETLKFYVLPIDSSFIIGGDWLKGNSCTIDYSKLTL
jgi:hypothetical protein